MKFYDTKVILQCYKSKRERTLAVHGTLKHNGRLNDFLSIDQMVQVSPSIVAETVYSNYVCMYDIYIICIIH